MFAGSSELPEPKQVIPQYLVGNQQEGGVWLAPSQGEELLSQLQGRLVLSPFSIELTEALQNREELRGVARELTEFSGSIVGIFHLIFINRAGTPPTTVLGITSFVTTLAAATTQPV